MSNNLPPIVLVKTWLDLLNSPETSQARKNQLKYNMNRFFGSIELASCYVDQYLK
jgi:hypothetical protein